MLIPAFNIPLHKISHVFTILIRIEEFILKVLCLWAVLLHGVIRIVIWIIIKIVLTLVSTSVDGRLRLGCDWLLELEVEVGGLEL